MNRPLRAVRCADEVVWFDFDTLCRTARSQNDYLDIASRFDTVMLSDVPQMDSRMASEARRFTWLIDVLYDQKVNLVISAEVPPDQFYTFGVMAHEFVHTSLLPGICSRSLRGGHLLLGEFALGADSTEMCRSVDLGCIRRVDMGR